jgi:hypothetical protein
MLLLSRERSGGVFLENWTQLQEFSKKTHSPPIRLSGFLIFGLMRKSIHETPQEEISNVTPN